MKTKAKAADDGLFGELPKTEPEKTSETKTKEKPPASNAKTRALRAAKTKGRSVVVHDPSKVTDERDVAAMILRGSKDPTVDVAKMKELSTLMLDLKRHAAVAMFNEAMHDLKGHLPRIVKDRLNPHTKAKYPTLENVAKNLDPLMHRYGFSMQWSTTESPYKDHYRLLCHLSHTGGDVRTYPLDLVTDAAGQKGTPNKSAVQGIVSSLSYGRRVMKMMVFDITPVGEDRDGNAPPEIVQGDVVASQTISQEQQDKLRDAIEACGVGNNEFCKYYGIKKVSDLVAARFDEAMKACKDHGERQRK